ncbi:MAG: Gfo/Idh/MocA family oxidoreductase [Candidatus Sungbacteria bacterium]|nr:Gfo/Idh/MocA family oxidoreductase [Candidatus Sungbacteria bacterium]
MKIKIIGAGSIGNHLAQASRRMGWDVVVVDKDSEALRRMKEDIYPKRYGAWDETIQLFTSDKEPRGGFDIIAIGTPPDARMKLALAALREEPKILQLEKPLCPPTLDGLQEFLDAAAKQPETVVIVGYDHAVAESIGEVVSILTEKKIGEVETLDVEFREHWGGIFAAHPWLSGPQDSYLGFWKRGGGAGGEHSHALHLWQFLAGKAGIGAWKKMGVSMEIKTDGGTEYDSVSAFLVNTDKGKVGRIVQDVVTKPVRKWMRAQGSNGFVEWFCGGVPEGDLVRFSLSGGEVSEKVFPKKRPDDFYREMLHMQDILDGKIKASESPLSLDSALSVIKILNKAYQARSGTFEVL